MLSIGSCSIPRSIIITDTDHDVEKLIEKTEKEGDHEEPEKNEGLSFAFAKIWAADKDTLEEMADDAAQINDKDDSWAQTLAVSFLSILYRCIFTDH